jgi:hypothetical protein
MTRLDLDHTLQALTNELSSMASETDAAIKVARLNYTAITHVGQFDRFVLGGIRRSKTSAAEFRAIARKLKFFAITKSSVILIQEYFPRSSRCIEQLIVFYLLLIRLDVFKNI